jgi:YHS domain-containing protein
MTEEPDTARDPVCKMEIVIEDALGEECHAGQTYYFCSEECAELFRKSPQNYLPRTAQA